MTIDANRHEVNHKATQVLGEVLGWDICPYRTSTIPPKALHLKSIFAALDERYVEYRSGSTEALCPNPELNSTLKRLVEISTTRFLGSESKNNQTDPAFHHNVVEQLTSQLKRNPEMMRRSNIVRQTAGIAEKQMESHYAQIALEQLSSAQPHEHNNRLAGLRRIFESFPYFRNYELLTTSELSGIHQIREHTKSIAFCGAGPLPLSGILAHLATGNRIELIEIDSQAACQAKQILRHLERLGLVETNEIFVTEADAASVDLLNHDLIMVASLVSETVLTTISTRNAKSRNGQPTPLLGARSASDLVSLFCYEPISIDQLNSTGWQHLGTVTPHRTLKDRTLKEDTEKRDTGTRSKAETILAITDPSVLNSTEFFQSVGDISG